MRVSVLYCLFVSDCCRRSDDPVMTNALCSLHLESEATLPVLRVPALYRSLLIELLHIYQSTEHARTLATAVRITPLYPHCLRVGEKHRALEALVCRLLFIPDIRVFASAVCALQQRRHLLPASVAVAVSARITQALSLAAKQTATAAATAAAASLTIV